MAVPRTVKSRRRTDARAMRPEIKMWGLLDVGAGAVGAVGAGGEASVFVVATFLLRRRVEIGETCELGAGSFFPFVSADGESTLQMPARPSAAATLKIGKAGRMKRSSLCGRREESATKTTAGRRYSSSHVLRYNSTPKRDSILGLVVAVAVAAEGRSCGVPSEAGVSVSEYRGSEATQPQCEYFYIDHGNYNII